MTGRPYPSYPEAEKACEEYAYVDPKNAHYGIAKLPREYHPLDAWKSLGTNDSDELLNRWHYPCIGVAGGFLITLINNYLTRQPLWSNIPRTILVPVGLGLVGEAVWRSSRARAAKRDAVIQNYLETHYDDFATIKRVKFGEVFLPWKVSR